MAALGVATTIAGAGSAGAQARPVTLQEALAAAERANPELQAALARVEAQQARTDSVRRLRWPRLGLSTSWSRSELPAAVFANRLSSGELTAADFDLAAANDPAPVNHLGSALSLELPVDAFGKLGAQAGAQAAFGAAASAAARDATQELRLRVVEAYWRAELAGRSVSVMDRVVEVAKAREAEILARVESGAALQADLLRSRARRREREAELAARRGDRRAALAGLARLLAAPAGADYAPSEEPPAVRPLAEDEPAWVERALRQRPLLEVARSRSDAAAALLDSERKTLLPDLGLQGQLLDNRIRAGEGRQSWALGISLRWSPYDPSRGRRQAAAGADARAAVLEARAAADQVRLDVAVAYRRAVSARERHAAAAGGAEEGREALRVVQERRRAGMATLTDELETETAALGAALQEIGAAAEVAIADAALARAAGEI